jgi:hypothetical protein
VKHGPEGEITDSRATILEDSTQILRLQESFVDEIQARNVARKRNNRGLARLLSDVVGENQGEEPDPWWDWWKKFNELDYTGPRVIRWANWWDQFQDSERLVQSSSRPRECFVSGTPVWSRRGMVPIETIVAGDEVLAQDQETGSLAYKIVFSIARRAPAPVVQVSVGNDEFVCTQGHRFWVSGAGWRMAKQIAPGVQLHSLVGPMPVTGVALSPDRETFNIIIEDYHTFFIGKGKILVHDTGAPDPTDRIVPGLPRSAAVH